MEWDTKSRGKLQRTKQAEVREGALGDDDIQARSSPTQAGCERARGNDNKAPSPQRDCTMIFVKGWGSLPTALSTTLSGWVSPLHV